MDSANRFHVWYVRCVTGERAVQRRPNESKRQKLARFQQESALCSIRLCWFKSPRPEFLKNRRRPMVRGSKWYHSASRLPVQLAFPSRSAFELFDEPSFEWSPNYRSSLRKIHEA